MKTEKGCSICGATKENHPFFDEGGGYSGTCKKFELQEENFDFFEQQQIIHGETTPQDIINERNKDEN